MDPTVRELVLLALLSAFLCGVALIYAEPIATAVFAALTSGCVVLSQEKPRPAEASRVAAECAALVGCST
jgi:hypothetical protein